MTKERPIIFSGPMVRAILEGRKTQTRRVVKPTAKGCRVGAYKTDMRIGVDPANLVNVDEENDPVDARPFRCPYGQPGDRLWVRETFSLENSSSVGWYDPPHSDGRPIRVLKDDENGRWWEQPHYRSTDTPPDICCENDQCRACREDGFGPHWIPSIHMPRWASRLTLEVTAVRVERLQEISADDATAEGIDQWSIPTGGGDFQDYQHNYLDPDRPFQSDEVASFRSLWNSINDKRGHGWDTNPWVWVVEFKKAEEI